VEVLLPNYLAVSKNKRSLGFYHQVNNFMVQDLVRACFAALARHRWEIQAFKLRRLQRAKLLHFTAMRSILRAGILLRNLLDGFRVAREHRVLTSVLAALQHRACYRNYLNHRFSALSKLHNSLIVHTHLQAWLQRYRKRSRTLALKTMGHHFVTERLFNKYLGIWIARLKIRLKKRYLSEVVLPQTSR
jgi:hypothetical protein